MIKVYGRIGGLLRMTSDNNPISAMVESGEIVVTTFDSPNIDVLR